MLIRMPGLWIIRSPRKKIHRCRTLGASPILKRKKTALINLKMVRARKGSKKSPKNLAQRMTLITVILVTTSERKATLAHTRRLSRTRKIKWFLTKATAP